MLHLKAFFFCFVLFSYLVSVVTHQLLSRRQGSVERDLLDPIVQVLLIFG